MNDDTILTYKLANPDLTGFNPYRRIEMEDRTDYYMESPQGYIRILTDNGLPLRGE
jgi:hypothetical protein